MSEAGEKARQQQQQQAHSRPPSAVAGNHAEPEQARPPQAEQPEQQQQQQQKTGQGQAWWRERRRAAQRAAGMTKLEEMMRDTPGLNRLVDGTLILGDVVMVVATEVRPVGGRAGRARLPAVAAAAASCSQVVARHRSSHPRRRARDRSAPSRLTPRAAGRVGACACGVDALPGRRGGLQLGAGGGGAGRLQSRA
jgi:hypothetical protein